MDGVVGILGAQVYKLDVEESMAPPEEERREEEAHLTSLKPGEPIQKPLEIAECRYTEEESHLTLLKPGEPVGLGRIQFKPIDGFYARTHSSPVEQMQYYGKWNVIRNVNLYTVSKMYQGIGSFIGGFLDIRI